MFLCSQLSRLSRRLTHLERQQEVQANRERAIVGAAFGYFMLKFFFWFFRSKWQPPIRRPLWIFVTSMVNLKTLSLVYFVLAICFRKRIMEAGHKLPGVVKFVRYMWSKSDRAWHTGIPDDHCWYLKFM